ncbi:hypothetical protein HKCCE2091_13975 [Rhodobacterales bacterium HKCCE2091]|nr:hypothetical protein [Rhodobacterales bacterium HKCCE2091]
MPDRKPPSLAEWLWPHTDFAITKSPTLGKILGTIIACIAFAVFVGIFWILVTFLLAVFHIGPYAGQQTHEAIRNIGLFLAAVFGAPFLAWRSWVAQRQADTAEQGLITDRLNKAVQGLGAEKTIKRHRASREGILLYEDGIDGKPDLKRPLLDELTSPNLEVRVGSIYALERVAKESKVDRSQIFEILCAYVSNNHDKPEKFSLPRLVSFDTTDLQPRIEERIRGAPDGMGRDWASGLKKPRADTKAAISVILRCIEDFGLPMVKDGQPTLVFQGANLQRADMKDSNLSGAVFEDCQLDGADLEKSDLSKTQFINCSMIGASINQANLAQALFWNSRLECVNAGSIKEMSGCAFLNCDCSGIMFSDGDMSNSHFNVAGRRAMFSAEKMDRTSFSDCDIRDGAIMGHTMRQMMISGTWVPEEGVQLMEKIDLRGGAFAMRLAKKMRLYFSPSQEERSYSSSFSASFLAQQERDQGEVELFDPDTYFLEQFSSRQM